MRALLQRVLHAELRCEEQETVKIGKGLLLYLCMAKGDTERELVWLHRKVLSLRIFDDSEGRFARSIAEEQGAVLIVPNFTLYAETKKGARPYFSPGIDPSEAKKLFQQFVAQCAGAIDTKAGVFGAKMHVSATLLGPVNIVIDVPAQPQSPGTQK